jgi:hypothetical protein
LLKTLAQLSHHHPADTNLKVQACAHKKEVCKERKRKVIKATSPSKLVKSISSCFRSKKNHQKGRATKCYLIEAFRGKQWQRWRTILAEISSDGGNSSSRKGFKQVQNPKTIKLTRKISPNLGEKR